MKRLLIITLGVILLFSPVSVFAKKGFQKGMSYPAYTKKVLSKSKSDLRLTQLERTGTKWVALVPVWYQKNYKSNNIYQASFSATDKSVIHAINKIHDLDMKVMLKPYVDSEDEIWRAEFEPRDFDTWFASYSDFLLHYASMAEDNNVEQLSLGVEYNFAESETAKWEQLIDEVRQIYSGKLTYSSNWAANYGEGGYRKIEFWDKLDFVGIDAYFPLTDDNYDPSVKQLKKGWNQWINQIQRWRKKNNLTDKKIIFTEIGYSSYDGVNTEPWGYDYDGKDEDQQEQKDCYKAFFKKVYPKKWMKGTYWWYWDNPSTNDSTSPKYLNFTTRKKLAAKTLRKYYKK